MNPPDPRPLGGRAYGSIPHLPGSRRGPADRGLSDDQCRRLLDMSATQKHDRVIVQEKLDGSNVSVAKVGGEVVAIGRAGFLSSTSPFEQHHLFARWVEARRHVFDALLNEGERVCGEWLAQAHGTRYDLTGRQPFVAFDLRTGHSRANVDEVRARCLAVGLDVARVVHDGPPVPVDVLLSMLEPSGHGAIGMVEGAVWRLEVKGQPNLIAKYVRPEKVDGCLLPEVSGEPAVWNWTEPVPPCE